MPNWIIKSIKDGGSFPIKKFGEPIRFGRFNGLTIKLYHIKDGPDQCFTITRVGSGRPSINASYTISAPMGYKLKSMGAPVFTEECKNLFKDMADELLKILL